MEVGVGVSVRPQGVAGEHKPVGQAVVGVVA